MTTNITSAIRVFANAISCESAVMYRKLLLYSLLVKQRKEMIDERGLTAAKLKTKLVGIFQDFVWR